MTIIAPSKAGLYCAINNRGGFGPCCVTQSDGFYFIAHALNDDIGEC